MLLLMTSANPGGEPLVVDEAEAVAKLGGLADALLVHDRAILARADDSVRRPLGRDAQGRPFFPFIRRARGQVPEPIALPGVPADAPSVLATGGYLKATVCLTRGNEAFVSPHLGDLGSAASRQGLVEAVTRLQDFLGVRPQAVAHDLHPDFFSTAHAQALAEAWQVPTVPVQHHHAHAAAVLAEHGHGGPALALVLDGVGLGSDGQPWGGELLRCERIGDEFTRLAHLPALPLPGGDRAAREPWRLGAALLHTLGRGGEIAQRFAAEPLAGSLGTVLDRRLNCPATASAGRLFDAAAALLAGVHHNGHEAEAAMRLEALALRHPGPATPWADAFTLDAHGVLDLRGLWTALADSPIDTPPPRPRPRPASTPAWPPRWWPGWPTMPAPSSSTPSPWAAAAGSTARCARPWCRPCRPGPHRAGGHPGPLRRWGPEPGPGRRGAGLAEPLEPFPLISLRRTPDHVPSPALPRGGAPAR
jgi:hydrogenase maturation protein HypF